jgi:hypothetical protein
MITWDVALEAEAALLSTSIFLRRGKEYHPPASENVLSDGQRYTTFAVQFIRSFLHYFKEPRRLVKVVISPTFFYSTRLERPCQNITPPTLREE